MTYILVRLRLRNERIRFQGSSKKRRQADYAKPPEQGDPYYAQNPTDTHLAVLMSDGEQRHRRYEYLDTEFVTINARFQSRIDNHASTIGNHIQGKKGNVTR